LTRLFLFFRRHAKRPNNRFLETLHGELNKQTSSSATAGHIDHGQIVAGRSFDRATHPDRPGKKKSAEGIHHRSGFFVHSWKKVRCDLALWMSPDTNASSETCSLGAAGIDIVLLVIAADESIKAANARNILTLPATGNSARPWVAVN